MDKAKIFFDNTPLYATALPAAEKNIITSLIISFQTFFQLFTDKDHMVFVFASVFY